jgi:hypothetical protein
MHYPDLSQRSGSRWPPACLLSLLALGAVSLLVPHDGLIKRNAAPADMPWFGSGLNSVFVLADGTWVITRSAYLDRRQRYEISPDGALRTFSDRSAFKIGVAEDASGGFSAGARTTQAGSSIGVKPSAEYYAWQSNLESHGGFAFLNPLPANEPAPPYSVTAAEVQLKLHAGEEPRTTGDEEVYYHDQTLPPAETGVSIRLNQRDRLVQFDLLPRHWFYEVADDIAFIDPHLYITTDRQRMLHKLRIDDDRAGLPMLHVECSVATGAPVSFSPRCQVGLDPRQHKLFLLRPDGSRFWFDPDTLAPLGGDQLPGVWEPEYAQFSLRPGPFSPYFGEPLSQRGYERLMQAAMLVFLASLLGLSLLWRPQWKSTSAVTTADSSSSEDSDDT